MNTFFSRKQRFFFYFLPISLLTTFFLLFSVFTLSACKNSVNYNDYVSELRANIFLGEWEDFSLRIYSVRKENPYATDGIPKEGTHRTEVYLSAPEGDETCNLTFMVNGTPYGGEMSFDNVRAEYYFFCTLDSANESRLDCEISYGEKAFSISALSVKTEDTLTPKNALALLIKEENELFKSLTDKYGFSGEIHLRLIYEDAPFYYVGIIDRTGKINAFLLNAQTGKILAKRTS